ncbi:MAG: GyrI-like domain-containing protein [Flavobacterium piscis]|nr:GyrI-like domain-containing protein [Flavobacterium piscis]
MKNIHLFSSALIAIIVLSFLPLQSKVKSTLSEVDFPSTLVIGKRDTIKGDMSKFVDKVTDAYTEIDQFVRANKVKVKEFPVVINEYWTKDVYYFISGFQVIDKNNAIPKGNLFYFELPKTKAVKAKVTGPYEEAEKVYKKIYQYIYKKHCIPAFITWEEYLNDPKTVKPNEIEYNIYVPFKEKDE